MGGKLPIAVARQIEYQACSQSPASGADDKFDHQAYDVFLADAAARGPCIWTKLRVLLKPRREASRMCS